MMMTKFNGVQSNGGETTRMTPDGISRLSHMQGMGIRKSSSPSPVTYSVSHQPHSNPNFPMSKNVQSYYSPMGQGGPINGLRSVKGDMNNMAAQRSNLLLSHGSGPSIQQTYPNAMHQVGHQTSVLGPASAASMTRAQQLKEMARKQTTAGEFRFLFAFQSFVRTVWVKIIKGDCNHSFAFLYRGRGGLSIKGDVSQRH